MCAGLHRKAGIVSSGATGGKWSFTWECRVVTCPSHPPRVQTGLKCIRALLRARTDLRLEPGVYAYNAFNTPSCGVLCMHPCVISYMHSYILLIRTLTYSLQQTPHTHSCSHPDIIIIVKLNIPLYLCSLIIMHTCSKQLYTAFTQLFVDTIIRCLRAFIQLNIFSTAFLHSIT